MKKIIISLLICTSIISCCLSGCGNDVSQNAENSISTNSVSESNKIVDIKTVEPPENGWTIESLMSATYIYGEQLCYPLRVNNLDEGFSIDDSEKMEISNNVDVRLLYNGKKVCHIGYYLEDIQDNYESAEAMLLSFTFAGTEEPECISINGISLGDSVDDIRNFLGEPDIAEDNGVYSYNSPTDGKRMLNFLFKAKERKIYQIEFFIRKEK